MLNDVRRVTNCLLQSLRNKCANPDEIRKADGLIKKLREKYETALEEYFKRMEVSVVIIIFSFFLPFTFSSKCGRLISLSQPKISAVFNIPKHVLLSEDEVQEKQFADNDLEEVDREIKELTSRYRRVMLLLFLINFI